MHKQFYGLYVFIIILVLEVNDQVCVEAVPRCNTCMHKHKSMVAGLFEKLHEILLTRF